MSINGWTDGDTNDVEKRWHDPALFRAAVTYVAMVIALAGLAFTATVVWRSLLAGILMPGILFVGGVGAFVQTYRVWRAEGVADLAGRRLVPAVAVPGLPGVPFSVA